MLDIAALQELGVDTDEGLAYCADDPEFYGEMLDEYIREGEEKIAELESFFQSRDWDNYRIRVHSVKNTSRMVGARELSERARELEQAAKEGDEQAILAGHASLLADLEQLLNGIRLVMRPA